MVFLEFGSQPLSWQKGVNMRTVLAYIEDSNDDRVYEEELYFEDETDEEIDHKVKIWALENIGWDWEEIES